MRVRLEARMSRPLAAVLILVALTSVGCRKKVKPVDDQVVDIPSVETRLQVAAVDPGQGAADATFDVEVLGAGFEEGARVSFSGAAADGVRLVDANTLSVAVPAMPAGSYDVTVVNPDGTKATLRSGLRLVSGSVAPKGCSPVTVNFAFDSSTLDAGARAALDAAAGCLREQGLDVRIEGHCDEKGTTDYNLALGQRRADAVLRYLQAAGIRPARLRAVSFGEERPVDRSGSEPAHAANRRAEVVGGGR
jgi:peptidoglycan-associated lipoprotein